MKITTLLIPGLLAALPGASAVSDAIFSNMKYAAVLSRAAYDISGNCAAPGGTTLIKKISGSATGFVSVDHTKKWIIVRPE
jgi:hypothetical protein